MIGFTDIVNSIWRIGSNLRSHYYNNNDPDDKGYFC